MKKSFLIYTDTLNVLDYLTDEQAGILFKAIKMYQIEGKVELNGLLKAVFTPFKTMFDKNNEEYEKVCQRNRQNGAKGGRPKTQTNPKNPAGFSKTQTNPKNLDNDNDNDNIINNKPNKKEIDDYCKLIGRKINIDDFIAYYNASDWEDKSGLPINWKQKIVSWSMKEKPQKEEQKNFYKVVR